MARKLTDLEKFESDPKRARLLSRAEWKLEATELIIFIMAQRCIKRRMLATRIGLTRRQLDNRLMGIGLTMDGFADLCWALDIRPQLSLIKRRKYRKIHPWPPRSTT